MEPVPCFAGSIPSGHVEELRIHQTINEFLPGALVAVEQRGSDPTGEVYGLDKAKQPKQAPDFTLFIVVAQREAASHLEITHL